MLIAVLFFFGSFAVYSRYSQRHLQQLLTNQGYQVVRITEPPLFRPGPFFMLNKRGWGVKRLTVRQSDGGERTGWIMYPAGLLLSQASMERYKVKFVWDDEWDPNGTPLWRQ